MSGDKRRASPALGWFGRLGAPVLAVAVYFLLSWQAPELGDDARLIAALAVLMATLWATEAMPLPATALLPLVVVPAAGVLTFDEVAGAYAGQVVFLMLGGLVIAQAMIRWELHRRLALWVVVISGSRQTRIIGGFMVATAALSMWISNTATAAMMVPIAVGLIALVDNRAGEDEAAENDGDVGRAEPGRSVTPALGANFAICLVLAIAYSASIGSVGTPISTPPNLILRGILGDTFGIDIGFAQWMLVGIPLIAVMLPLTWLLLTRVIHPIGDGRLPGGRALARSELAAMGPVNRGEWTVIGVFATTVLAWILREPLTNWAWLVDFAPWVANVNDATIAIAGALLLFAIPVDARGSTFALDWRSTSGLPWGILVLIGGGLALAKSISVSGLDVWIGLQVAGLEVLPTFLMVVGIIALTTFLTEITSNTATAATILPVLAGVAGGIGVDPLLLMLPATFALSFCFMLPAATPPNAIVFGSGYVSVPDMVRSGFRLSLVAVVAITAITYLVAVPVLGITT